MTQPPYCWLCTSSKPCGDSCIAARSNCTRSPGYACSAAIDYERGLYHVVTQEGEVYELVLSDAELAYLRDEPVLSSCSDGANIIDGMRLSES